MFKYGMLTFEAAPLMLKTCWRNATTARLKSSYLLWYLQDNMVTRCRHCHKGVVDQNVGNCWIPETAIWRYILTKRPLVLEERRIAIAVRVPPVDKRWIDPELVSDLNFTKYVSAEAATYFSENITEYANWIYITSTCTKWEKKRWLQRY